MVINVEKGKKETPLIDSLITSKAPKNPESRHVIPAVAGVVDWDLCLR